MTLKLVERDEINTILPLINIIGKAVRFEYFSSGELIAEEGILRSVNQEGVMISLYNPLIHKKLRILTFNEGLKKYFPFVGENPIVRIVESKNQAFTNTVENVWGTIEEVMMIGN